MKKFMQKVWEIAKKVWNGLKKYGTFICKAIILLGCSVCACWAGIPGVILGILNICISINPLFTEYTKLANNNG